MKRDINDDKFSKLKRMHRTTCQRCEKEALLQACHVFSRGHHNTRFNTDNAIVLCYACHKWFDTHKIFVCLFDETKRVFSAADESFHFLVLKLGYTWEQLLDLYHLSQKPFQGYKSKKKDISKQLDELIEKNN